MQKTMRTIIPDYWMPLFVKFGFILNNYVNDLTFVRLYFQSQSIIP